MDVGKSVTVREVPASAELLDQIGRLRVRAWATEIAQMPDLDCWIDPIDHAARHFVIHQSERLIGAARLTIHEQLDDVPDAAVYRDLFPAGIPGPIGTLSRLVVDPAARRQGCGTALDRARIEAARRAGCRSLLGSSSAERRINQLRQHGFDIVGRMNPNPHPVFQNRGLQTVLRLSFD